MPKKNTKIVLKIFDSKEGEEKRAHNCYLCQIYKREIKKGNKDAYEFYRQHINEWVKKYKGATIVFDSAIYAYYRTGLGYEDGSEMVPRIARPKSK
ncbi:MAG: hypothetical protein M1504_02625 [Candidatus Marsarchaeota archaeon]|nr:hypothetical protein [Candidatus Marsarchaeota archaeon]